mgnify:CR=1 FL=1
MSAKKYLVIVESPEKSKNIHGFLGSNYKVIATKGHVRDLPKSELGIDIENDFEPKYITIRGKGEILAQLRKEVKKADKVYLATDPDREGEAISWHLLYALKLDPEKTKYRIPLCVAWLIPAIPCPTANETFPIFKPCPISGLSAILANTTCHIAVL